MRWALEFSDIKYRPGSENVPCDTLTRVCYVSSTNNLSSLKEMHASLCHPGVNRLYNFVNLAFSLECVKGVCSQCTICSELKLRFFKTPANNLIKAMQLFDRISVYFANFKSSFIKDKYLFVMIDEYSRFSFNFLCSDMSSYLSVIACFRNLFSIFVFPFVHSDRGTQFMSCEVLIETRCCQNSLYSLSPYW